MGVKNIEAYKEAINETLEWMEEERTADEFDRWFYDRDTVIEIVDGRPIKKKIFKPVEAQAYTRDTYLLGSIPSGTGPDSWGGRLHLVQILAEEGYVDISKNDNDEITYKTIKKFPNS